jgi:hypothetical protein
MVRGKLGAVAAVAMTMDGFGLADGAEAGFGGAEVGLGACCCDAFVTTGAWVLAVEVGGRLACVAVGSALTPVEALTGFPPK